jgi:predicted HicB family RNase H-like nuclease
MVGAPSIALYSQPVRRISLVQVSDDAGEVWQAEVEDFPHCAARAATPEEAVRRAWAAVGASLEKAADDGASGSQPTSGPRHSGKLLVRMPATLHDELAHTAESEGVSLNQLITGILASSVEWRTADTTVADAGETERSRRLTYTVLAANFALVLLAAIVAVALLLTAWLD